MTADRRRRAGNEITFNASLLGELRAIRFVTRLIKDGKLSRSSYKQLRMHMISLYDEIHGLTASSKLDASWEFVTSLRDAGARAAKKWLHAHFEEVGVASIFDIWKEVSASRTPPATRA